MSRISTYLTLLVAIILASFHLSCAPGEFGAGAKVANTVLSGAACGMAAANGTPCTPQAVLDALAKDAAAQREKVQAVIPQAKAVDPNLTDALAKQLEQNTASNKALVEAIVLLASRQPGPVAPATSSTVVAPSPSLEATTPPTPTTSSPPTSTGPPAVPSASVSTSSATPPTPPPSP